MIRESVNAGWSAGPGLKGFGRIAGRSEAPLSVTLPYEPGPRPPRALRAERTTFGGDLRR